LAAARELAPVAAASAAPSLDPVEAAAFGTLHLLRVPVRVRPPRDASRLVCPLSLSVDYEEAHFHPFVGAEPCAVPVTVTLVNGALPGSAPLSFAVELLEPSETLPVAGGGPGTAGTVTAGGPLRPRFFWAGSRRKRVEGLAPGARVSVRLLALFVEPGSYNLNRFRFVVDGPGSPPASGPGSSGPGSVGAAGGDAGGDAGGKGAGSGPAPQPNTFVFPYQYPVRIARGGPRAPLAELPRPGNGPEGKRARGRARVPAGVNGAAGPGSGSAPASGADDAAGGGSAGAATAPRPAAAPKRLGEGGAAPDVTAEELFDASPQEA
jgi:hypothetical protein